MDVPFLEVFWGLGRVRVRRCQVGEGARCWLRRLVDAVADPGPVPGVDQQREQRVDDVVVEGPTPTGLVRASPSGGQLDLQEGALLGVGLGEVYDEEVGQQQFGQRVRAVLAGG